MPSSAAYSYFTVTEALDFAILLLKTIVTLVSLYLFVTVNMLHCYNDLSFFT